MRKSRKVMADVLSSPKESPPSSPPKPMDTSPMCFHCNKAKVKELLIVGQRRANKGFCSVSCAIDFALYTMDHTGKVWFPCEQKWLTGKEAAKMVEEREIKREDSCIKPIADAQADEKGVDSDK